MKGRISNPQGDVMIRTDVIAKYAGSMAVECFGIVGMASVSMKDGLVHLLKKDSITRGINVSLEDNELTIDFHVIVSYGVSILAVPAITLICLPPCSMFVFLNFVVLYTLTTLL